MTVVTTAPDRDLIWRSKVEEFGGAADRPLDGLPPPAAAWWPGWQLFSTYAAALVSCENADGSPSGDVGAGTTGQVHASTIAAAGALQDQLAAAVEDQSGNARSITSAAAAAAPKLFDQATARFVQQNLSLVLGYDVARAMTRGDALGLAADPALTIAFKTRFATIGVGLAPNVLALGDAVTPELCLFGTRTASPADGISLTSFDGAFGASWILPVNTIDKLHSYVVTKPAGTGYDASTWKLLIDGVDQGPPSNSPGTLALGSALTQLGDVPGGGFGLDGTLAGMIVWASVLDAGALTQLQAFLDSV